MMRHTESDDVNRLIVGIPAFILLCLLVAGLWNSAHGAPSNGYRVSSTWRIGWDSTRVTDSAILYVFKDFANDTAFRVFPLYPPDTIQNHPKEADSVARVRTGIWAPVTWVVGGYNPAFFVVWFQHTAGDTTSRFEEYDDNPKWTVQIISTDSAQTVDTLLTGVAATATVDYDSIAAIVSANAGAGSGPYADTIFCLNSADSSAIGGALVWLYDGDGTLVGKNVTDANGFAEYGQLADSLYAYSWAPGFFPVVTPVLNVVTVDGANDTVFMSTPSPAPPLGPGLTGITFNLWMAKGDSALDGASLFYKLESTGLVNYHSDSSKILDPGKIYDARTDSNGQVTVYVVPNDSIYTDGFISGKTKWRFWATNPLTGLPLLGENGVAFKVPASATILVWPKDFK